MKYLYGASIQGIQSFIFETNELKDIVGASEMIELITDKESSDALSFRRFFNEGDEYETVMAAAGNIRLISDRKETYKKIVLEFPKHLTEYAPGLTVSQAVVEVQDDGLTLAFQKLEEKLKIQRNIRTRTPYISALGIERAPRTGKSAVSKGKKGPQDRSSLMKNKYADNEPSLLASKLLDSETETKKFPKNVSDIVKGMEISWLSVIHADANDLGKLLQKVSDKAEKDSKLSVRDFSEKLNRTTVEAAKQAFEEIIAEKSDKGSYPFRPIVIGGDDLTVICRGDLALGFTETYIKAFESLAKVKLEPYLEGETIKVCAGISYVKDKFPFHYAVKLADDLCSYAKKVSKEKARGASSIMFHKVQSSFISSFNEIKKRELYANASDIDLCYGPYAVNNEETGISTLDQLFEYTRRKFTQKNYPVSSIRRLLQEMYTGTNSTDLLWNRIKQVNRKTVGENESYQEESNGKKRSIFYDALTIYSIEGEKKCQK